MRFTEGTVVRRQYITERATVVMVGQFEVVLLNEVGHLHTVKIEAFNDGSYELA